MTPDEAIEILEYHRVAVGDVAGSDYANALKLGIEALERERFMREYSGITELLPSETEEGQ